jgi:hypothetical protein
VRHRPKAKNRLKIGFSRPDAFQNANCGNAARNTGAMSTAGLSGSSTTSRAMSHVIHTVAAPNASAMSLLDSHGSTPTNIHSAISAIQLGLL